MAAVGATSLGGLATAAAPGARRVRRRQANPTRTSSSYGFAAAKFSGGCGVPTRAVAVGEVGGVGCRRERGSAVGRGGGRGDCRDDGSGAASGVGVGVAGCNAGNGVGGARVARTLRNGCARYGSASQRREAAAGAVDGGTSESSTAGTGRGP